MSETNTCGCGRSPTGKCVGWHNLTEEQYAEKKAQWEAKQEAKMRLMHTDWYVTRKSEKGTAIPSDVQTDRDAIRTACTNHETAINAKTTKAQVMSYDITY